MNTNQNTSQEGKADQYYRFRLLQGKITTEGRFERSKSVGMAYLREGQRIYTLRLWMFLDARYYLTPVKDSTSRYFLMTREPVKHQNSKNKFFWNIVGNAEVDAVAGVMRIHFDLLEQPIYMTIYPEAQARAAGLPGPEVPDFLSEGAFDAVA